MTTYTILENGKYTSGLDLIEAADILLGNDGHQHEMRQDEDGGWSLWVSQYSRNSTLGGRPLVKSTIYTLEQLEELAARDIAEKVIGSGRWTTGSLNCMTDEQYTADTLSIITDAKGNDQDGLISGIKYLYNCADAMVDDNGDIWIEGPMCGHWLDIDGKMRIARALAAGDI